MYYTYSNTTIPSSSSTSTIKTTYLYDLYNGGYINSRKNIGQIYFDNWWNNEIKKPEIKKNPEIQICKDGLKDLGVT